MNPLQPLRLLLVEDSIADAELMLRELRRTGFEPQCQRVDTEEEYIGGLHAGLDLIISDHALPQFDGLRALDLRNQQGLAVPFIIVSGTIGEQTAVDAMQRGAADYLLKDRLARLGPAVRHALAEAAEHRQRAHAEQALRESEARFRQLAENSSEVFWFVALNPERYTFISPSVEKISGWAAARYYDDPQCWTKSIHPDDLRRVMLAAEALRSGQSSRFLEEYRIVRPDGTARWVLDSGTAIRATPGGEITSFAGVAHDVTERKQAEELLLRTQRLENLGMLAAGIAHDFNNTLTPLFMVGPLLRQYISDPQALPLLDSVDQSARRGGDLVQQLLSFARGGTNETKVFRIDPLLREVMSLARATFPKLIKAVSRVADELWPVQGNPTQFHQIILNLFINARDAMPEGGELTLDVTNCTLGAVAAASIPGGRPGQFLAIEVSDTGTGIPPATLARMWEPFFTTKGEGKGTGLGLATVRGIVHTHGGFVRVRTRLGFGTAFTVYLPAIVDPWDESKAAGPHEGVERSGDDALILVVDDDKLVRELATTALVAHGYRVMIAGDGEEALAIFTPYLGEARLLLTDDEMPRLGGEGLIAAIHQQKPNLPVVIMSGVHRLAGAVGLNPRTKFLAKPFQVEALVSIVHRSLADAQASPSAPPAI